MYDVLSSCLFYICSFFLFFSFSFVVCCCVIIIMWSKMCWWVWAAAVVAGLTLPATPAPRRRDSILVTRIVQYEHFFNA